MFPPSTRSRDGIDTKVVVGVADATQPIKNKFVLQHLYIYQSVKMTIFTMDDIRFIFFFFFFSEKGTYVLSLLWMITLLLRSPFSRLNRNIFFLEKLSFATICAKIDNKKNTDKICVSVLIIHIMKTFKRLVELPRSSLFLSCSRRAATPLAFFFTVTTINFIKSFTSHMVVAVFALFHREPIQRFPVSYVLWVRMSYYSYLT